MNEKQAVDLRALLRTVDKIKPTLRENTALGERICRLPDTSMNAMREAGLYRMWVPKTLGGLELDPMTVFEVLEAIARIDAAASWNLFMGVTPTLMGAWLSEDAASTIYSDGLVMAGALFPPLPAAPVQGGYLLSGRAPFVSGCHAATWYVFASMVVEDGQPKTDGMGNPIALAAFVPRSEVEIVENWDTLGMRGTGSHDVVLKDAFIPEQLAPLFVPYGDHPPGPAFQGPLYRLAIWSATPAAVAVSLGIARAAIEDVVRLAHQKTPAYTVTPLRERPVT
jgi:alkylation response protein AidB-like acyl-CoA dehydrogenase